LPYAHFDTYKNVKRLKKKTGIGEAKECDSDSSEATPYFTETDDEKSNDDKKSSEANKSNEVGDSDDNCKATFEVIEKNRSLVRGRMPLHRRMTLSQFYYGDKLSNSKQIITRHFYQDDEWMNEDPLALVVDQLWMLVLTDGIYSYYQYATFHT